MLIRFRLGFGLLFECWRLVGSPFWDIINFLGTFVVFVRWNRSSLSFIFFVFILIFILTFTFTLNIALIILIQRARRSFILCLGLWIYLWLYFWLWFCLFDFLLCNLLLFRHVWYLLLIVSIRRSKRVLIITISVPISASFWHPISRYLIIWVILQIIQMHSRCFRFPSRLRPSLFFLFLFNFRHVC